MKGVLLNQAASHTGREEWLRGCDIITVLYRSIMYILREKKPDEKQSNRERFLLFFLCNPRTPGHEMS